MRLSDQVPLSKEEVNETLQGLDIDLDAELNQILEILDRVAFKSHLRK